MENHELIVAADQLDTELAASVAHATEQLQEADQGHKDGGIVSL